ncbi:MAG: hypothetical protein WEB52_04005 [Dehalococcoidia bacterium]
MSNESGGELVSIPLLWDGLDTAEIKFVNQMIVQLGPPGNESEFLVTLGQLHPPVLMGSEDENKARLAALPYVTVKVVAKVALPVSRVREFRDLMTRMLETYEQATDRR